MLTAMNLNDCGIGVRQMQNADLQTRTPVSQTRHFGYPIKLALRLAKLALRLDW